MDTKKHYRTLVLSDIHLGMRWSKVEEVTRFLSLHTCDTLILCGDIIDGWNLMRGRKDKWKTRHTEFIRLLLDMQHTVRIVYVKGNHDDFLQRIAPFSFGNIQIVKDYIHTAPDGKRYYVLHGDTLDEVTSRHVWLSKLGDVAYNGLLWLNDRYNQWRTYTGKPYYSISRKLKDQAKKSVSGMSAFSQRLTALAREQKCDGVICGHIHRAEISRYGDVDYLNSGDWVESLTALGEDEAGAWHLCRYASLTESCESFEPVPADFDLPSLSRSFA